MGRAPQLIVIGPFQDEDADGNPTFGTFDAFTIFSLQDDDITPTTFENAIVNSSGVEQGLFPNFIEDSDPTIDGFSSAKIEYRNSTSIDNSSDLSFILEDEDGIYSNGFQVNGLEIDVERAQNDFQYVLENGLLASSEIFDFDGSVFVDGPPSILDLSSVTAVKDFASTKAGQSVTIDVLENDIDIDDKGIELSLNSISSQEGGTVEQIDGQILFTPGEDFIGVDSFTYDLSRNDLVIDSATVTVGVFPVPVFGTVDGDIIEIKGSNQLVFAGGSEDLVDAFTGEGNNRIYAGSGDDILILGESDRFFGGKGNDSFFVNDRGNNTITGGKGADEFWIATGEFPNATNRITDFTIGEDVIGIAGLEIGFEDITLTQNGDDALIAAKGNDLAVFKDISITNFSESDFAFG